MVESDVRTMGTVRKRAAGAACTLLVGMWFAAIAAVPATAATIRVHYDTGWGHSISIRGSKPPLSWSDGRDATWTTGNVWVYSWPDSTGDVELKPLVDDATWSTGGNYIVKAGTTVDIYPFFGASVGRLVQVNNFYSPQLRNYRSLIIYLPPSYSENTFKRYPVLYMHDGQNIFQASTAFGGVEWGVDETANTLVQHGLMEETLIVGIYNTGANRIYEYAPCCDPTYGGGGANLYERFVIDTVKPWIDSRYRTLTGREDTAMMGSSLGGLVSFYIGRRNPATFSKVAGMSSSFWWNNQALTRTVETSTAHVPVSFYIDAGTVNDRLSETTRMRDALVAGGYVQGRDLYYYIANGASHNETSWAARVYIPLEYLFPWQGTDH